MKKVIFNDTSDWAEMIFPNGAYIKVNYKYMKDEHIIFHYNLGSVNGTMKIKPQWTKDYDDIMGQAECSLPHMFLPTILNYLYEVDNNRLNHYDHVVKLYDKGKTKAIMDISWTRYHDIKSNPKRIKELRALLKLQTHIVNSILKMKKYLN